LGAIGKKVAKIAWGFDMNILVHTPQEDEAFAKVVPLSYVSKASLLSKSDIISLHLPLLASTQAYLSKSDLDSMKNTAILINTARGGLVDQVALVEALSEGRLLGAGLDDFLLDCKSAEQLMSLENVVLTPHIGFNTKEALVVKTDACLENIAAFVGGNPINVLNE